MYPWTNKTGIDKQQRSFVCHRSPQGWRGHAGGHHDHTVQGKLPHITTTQLQRILCKHSINFFNDASPSVQIVYDVPHTKRKSRSKCWLYSNRMKHVIGRVCVHTTILEQCIPNTVEDIRARLPMNVNSHRITAFHKSISMFQQACSTCTAGKACLVLGAHSSVQ